MGLFFWVEGLLLLLGLNLNLSFKAAVGIIV